MNKNILIGGEAGQGLKTISVILGKTLFRMGYNIFSSKDYMSRIRGGHNFIKIRFGTDEISGPVDKIDILVALNPETVEIHKDNLADDGVIIVDQDLDTEKNLLYLPASKIASEINKKALNTVYAGAVLKVLGLKLEESENIIKEYFSGKEKIINDNFKLLKKGYQKADTRFSVPEGKKQNDIYLDGNKAVGLGALTAGLKFYTAYPMSPSTSIMNYIAGKQKELGIVVEQAEDEIAAINMALGASYGGVRAMTATSGGGLALMAEAVGLSGITETPLVIADVQRPGPATGLPTRTEQGDLLFTINIAQGEFPLMVIAPVDHENAFYQTVRAFKMADKYQIPVILLSDQFLADSARNIKEVDLEGVDINQYLVSSQDYQNKPYFRYENNDNGISPRAYPGQLKDKTVLVDSDEHDQKGHIIEDAETRIKMVEKRNKKLEKLIKEDLKEPQFFGDNNCDYLLIGWGSTKGPILEALKYLNSEEIKTGFLAFSDIWPLPKKKLHDFASRDIESIIIENNSTAQFARLIRSETGLEINHQILKYSGRPFSGQEIFERIKKEVIK